MNLRFKILSAAVFIFTMYGCQSNDNNQQAQKTSYKLLTIEEQPSENIAKYTASIRGKQDIEIYPQVGGYLKKVNVTEGQQVRKNEVLFTIEQAPYIAALEAAKARVEMSEAAVATATLNYSNAQSLKEQEIVSDVDLQIKQNDLSNAQAQLSLAEADLLSAEVNLGFTVIKSPADGVVGKLPYREGTLVSANMPQSLTTVSDNSQMFVYFSMSENQILDLFDKYKTIDTIIEKLPAPRLQLANGSVYAHAGAIQSISGIIENTTGAVSIRATFPNPQRNLLSGGSGNILLTDVYANSIVIPMTATFELQDKVYVYKIVDNKTTSTIVEVSSSSDRTQYVVESGLQRGDVIIAEGAGLVRDGQELNQ